MRTSKRKREPQPVAPEPAANEQPIVTLPATCTFRELGELKSSLLRWTTIAEPVTLNVAALQRIDAAAMQVVCAFVRDRHSEKLAVQWQGHSDVLMEAGRLLGLTATLGLTPASA